MARGGLNKTDIQKARDSLLAQGKHPSVDAVRVALGNTGSKTTIHRYLKEIGGEEGRLGNKVAVSDALQDLVGRLSRQLHIEAKALVAEGKAKADAIVCDRDEALAHRNRELEELQGRLQAAEQALASEKADHALALQQAQASARQRQEALEQLVGVRDELQALRARMAQEGQAQARIAREHEQLHGALAREREARLAAERSAVVDRARAAAVESLLSEWQLTQPLAPSHAAGA